jgi:hypothetical protein
MCCAQRVARPADSLPDDIDSLRALALNAIAESDAAIAERDQSGLVALTGLESAELVMRLIADEHADSLASIAAEL